MKSLFNKGFDLLNIINYLKALKIFLVKIFCDDDIYSREANIHLFPITNSEGHYFLCVYMC